MSKQHLSFVKELLAENFNIEADQAILNKINEIVIRGNQSRLFSIEMRLCQSQKEHCVQQIHHALDTYHHAGMDTQEIKTIVGNVLVHKVPTPDITDTVRLLIAD